MQQQPNAPPLPPTRLPIRYPNRPHRRRHPRLNVDGVLGGNGYYPNNPDIEANGFYLSKYRDQWFLSKYSDQ